MLVGVLVPPWLRVSRFQQSSWPFASSLRLFLKGGCSFIPPLQMTTPSSGLGEGEEMGGEGEGEGEGEEQQ